MKLLILLSIVTVCYSATETATDKPWDSPFERAAGAASNTMPAGSAAYNAQQYPNPPSPYQQMNQYQAPPSPSQWNQPPSQYPGNQAVNQYGQQYPPTPSTPSPLLVQVYEKKPEAKYATGNPGMVSPPLAQIQTALSALEVVRQSLVIMAGQGAYQTCFDDGCDLTRWKKCTCISPAVYDNEGRGNCNLGATKLDSKVWCYIDPRNGDARTLCPDAQASPTKPGYFWSRFACIT